MLYEEIVYRNEYYLLFYTPQIMNRKHTLFSIDQLAPIDLILSDFNDIFIGT